MSAPNATASTASELASTASTIDRIETRKTLSERLAERRAANAAASKLKSDSTIDQIETRKTLDERVAGLRDTLNRIESYKMLAERRATITTFASKLDFSLKSINLDTCIATASATLTSKHALSIDPAFDFAFISNSKLVEILIRIYTKSAEKVAGPNCIDRGPALDDEIKYLKTQIDYLINDDTFTIGEIYGSIFNVYLNSGKTFISVRDQRSDLRYDCDFETKRLTDNKYLVSILILKIAVDQCIFFLQSK